MSRSVDLVPVRDGFVTQAVGAALDVAEGPQQPLESAVAGGLGRSRVLLVLDNRQHLLEAVAGFAAAAVGVPWHARAGDHAGAARRPRERLVAIEPLPLASDAVALF